MYIRTKDGVYEFQRYYANFDYYWVKRLSEPIAAEDILNQSENLEELCDEFVFVNKIGNFDKSYVIPYNMPNHIFTEPTIKEKIAYIKKEYYEVLNLIKGAIYTDKGLIYVAKMNQEGELELI